MEENKRYFREFLLKDFDQQYQEYRQAETSRIRYVEFLISLVVAVLAFFAAFYNTVGFPASNIYPMWIVFFISIVLFFIGYGITNICISTRMSQMQTAKYLDDVTKHFFKLGDNKALETSRKRIYFAEEDWASEKTPFFGLMKIITFLVSVTSALTLFSLFRLVLAYLESSPLIPVFKFAFWDYLSWSHVISVTAGLITLILAYVSVKRKIQNHLKDEQGKS